jgi:CHAT domain-containing protein/Tfp pilus assembly protein PilF
MTFKTFPLHHSIQKVLFIALTISLLFSCSQNVKIKEKQSIVDSIPLKTISTGDSLFKLALYDQSITVYSEALKTGEKSLSIDQKITLILKIAENYRVIGNTEKAIAKIAEAEKLILQNKKYRYLYGDLLHKKGLILNDQGYFDSAIVALNSSIREKTIINGTNDTTQALTYNSLGVSYFFKTDYDSALKYYTRAYELLASRINFNDADLAMVLQNIGIINAQKGQYDKAEEAFANSLEVYEKLLTPYDPELSRITLNVGRLKAIMNKDHEALALYNRAEEILLKTSADYPILIYIYSNKGQTYVHLADYEKALIYFNKALALAQASMDPKHPQILSLNMNIGYVYEQKKDYKNALNYYLASLPADPNSQASVKTYANLASLYNSLKDTRKADEYYRKALDLAVRYYGPDHPETGLLYTRYGYFLLFDPVKNDELSYFNKALEISLKNFGKKSREVSNNYMHIGSYYFTHNKLNESLKYYQAAINAIIPDYNNTDIYSNPVIKNSDADKYILNALNGKGEALSMAGSDKALKHSLETYKLSIKVIDNLRSAFQDEESKLMIAELSNKTFQKTVDVGIQLYNTTHNKNYLEEAFRFADKSQSSVLIRSIHDVESQHFTKIPTKVLNLEKKLKLNISTFRRLIYEEHQKSNPDANLISSWESKVFENTVRYDSLAGFLEKSYPDYYKLKYTEPTVDVAVIQKSLENDRVLIEYMLCDSTVNIFAISNKSIQIFKENIDSTFFKDLRTVVSSTNNSSMFSVNEKDYKNYAIAAHRLYNKLLLPVSKQYSQKKITIIPDGEMGYLSFDLLLTKLPDTNNMDFRGLHYLINDKIVSYSTSAILQFSEFRKRQRKATKNFLAVAPSYENTKSSKEPLSFIDENGNKTYLLPIPGVENEIEGIDKAFSITKIKGEKATENKFKNIAGDYNILHLAMHTLVNNSQPMLSKLVFYQNNDTVEDGLLNTYELFGMDLNAGLAVLSACNTGTGKLLEGEGIMNLARGFIYAGVPAIVMTMWSVDDQSSSDIVNSFYKYLREGMPKDEALRQAKLDFLAEKDPLRSHPFYWAAYINVGDNVPMKFRNSLLTSILIGLSLVLLIGGYRVYHKRKVRRKLVTEKQTA